MLVVGSILIAIGLVVALLGVKLFRLLLPVIGLVSGAMAGFIGVQAVFGTGVVATSIALIAAIIFGVLLGILSFAFFDLAVIIYTALLGAAALSYVGVSLGLSQEGLLVFLLGVTGAVIAAYWASRSGMSVQIVMALTSFVGVAYVLVGLMLAVGNVSFDQFNNNGIAGTIVDIVDQSFLWFLVWIGGSLLAWAVQLREVFNDVLTNTFSYIEKERL